MALSVTNSPRQPRSFSLGPVKVQLLDYTVGAADTTGTFVADALSSVDYVVAQGLQTTAQPSSTGNSITLAFTAPGAALAGKIMVFGR